MSHRIDIELTSDRGDGSWTWRAAGARQPKGVVDAGLLPDGVEVGAVVRAEVHGDADGISIVSVLPPKQRQRAEPERIEILGSGPTEGGVTAQLAGGRRRGRDDGDERPRGRREGAGRRDGDRRRGPRPEGRDSGRERGPSGRRDRSERTPRPDRPERPRPKRLRPGRAHRQELVRQLPPEQRPLAELVLRGGVPLVREVLDGQRRKAEAEGIPAVRAEPVLDVAEKLAPHARLAEWQDRADAALAQAGEVDLRDLRSVVVAAEGVARHEQTRETADQLRAALAARVEAEHRAWLDELGTLVTEGRVVAALRVSSRPPKAGTPLPAPLAQSLGNLAASGLTPDTGPDRYVAVLEALALSPVRLQVVPAALRDPPPARGVGAVRRLGNRRPRIGAAIGIEPAPAPRRRPPGRRPAVSAGRPGPPATPPPAAD